MMKNQTKTVATTNRNSNIALANSGGQKKTCAKDDFETPMAILVYNPARTFVATTR